MARVCTICNKRTVAGNSISHAHNVTKRTWRPNLQRVRAVVDGAVRRVWVCTRCLRSGKVEKPPFRDWQPAAGGAEEEAAT
jgi:large subunit ribosomal protein L28